MRTKYKFNYIFYLAYSLFIINSIFIKNIDSNIYKVILIFNIILFLINAVFKSYTKNQIIIIIIIGLLLNIISINAKDSNIIILYIIIISSIGFKLEKIMKLDLLCRSISVVGTIILSIINITNDFLMYRIGEDGSVYVRHSLGFEHPNTLSNNIFIILITYIYMKYDKFKLIDTIFVVSIGYICNLITGARTSMICVVLIVILMFLDKRINILQNKYLRKIFIIIVPLCTIISLILVSAYKYDIRIIEQIDTLLTGRIKSASYFLANYNISILGQKLELVSIIQSIITTQQQRILDNLYVKTLINYGILAIILYNLVNVKLMKLFFEKKNNAIIIIMFIISIYGILESMIIVPSFSLILILTSDLLLKIKRVYDL